MSLFFPPQTNCGKRLPSVPNEVVSAISAMQSFCGELAEHFAVAASRGNKDLGKFVTILRTARNDRACSQTDGVWGANTEKALNLIQEFISNPKLNTKVKITDSVDSRKPTKAGKPERVYSGRIRILV